MIKKQVLQNTVGITIFTGSQWFILILIVRMLDYEYAGMFSIATTLTALFFIISSYGIRSFQVSDVISEYSDQQYILTQCITTIIGFFVCVLYLLLMDYSEIQEVIVIIWMVYKSLEALSAVIYGIFQNKARFDRICISLSVKGIGQIIAFWIGLYFFTSLLYAMIFAVVFNFIIIVVYDMPHGKESVSPLFELNNLNWKRSFSLIKKCFPLVIVFITTPLLQAIPRVYYEEQFSSELFGIFSSVAAPIVIFQVLVTSILIPFMPKFAKHHSEKDSKSLSRLLLFTAGGTFIFGVAAFVASIFIGEFALVLLYDESIRPYSEVLYGIIVVVVLTAVLACFITLFIAARKLITLSVTLVIGCGICYLVTPYFINIYEMDGISFAMITGQVMSIVILTGVFVRLLYTMRKHL